jgi:amino acid adenylation domain-containing protein
MSARWLHLQFESHAAVQPQAGAVSCNGIRLSYGELNRKANELAARLANYGVGRGSLVAMYFHPGTEHIVSLLAVMKAGAAWVALEPAWPAERINEVLAQAGPQLLIHGNDLQGDWPDCLQQSFAAVSAAEPVKDFLQPDLCADDRCYLMFTSGSSGTPNGVEVNHGNVVGLIANIEHELQLSGSDRWSALHSAAFGYSLWEIWGALSTGAELEIVPAEHRADPCSWDARLREAGVSVLSLTPSGLRQWLVSGCSGPWPELRLVVLSGEAMTPEDAAAWFEQQGDAAPKLINTYALTETAGRVAMTEVVPGQASALLGSAVTDAELFLLDSDNLHAVADGETGEVFVAGDGVAKGYLHNPSLTAERFVRHDPGDGRQRRLYRTGDRAQRLNDGRLEFVGRADAQIKLHGYRIELADIEAALEQHPGVAQAAVVLQGESGRERLHAVVVPAEATREGEPEFWPSLGEYQIYDALLYDFMSADEVRVEAYRRAFEGQVAGKVALDIGTGKDALLARLCVQAGAKHVYAVEVLPDAAASAAQLVAELGLQSSITVICGDMQDIELPEPVDLCTQGIVGNIGSSDGIVPIWNRASRFFKQDFVAVPARCHTMIAPASLPDQLRDQPAFGSLAGEYARRIFAAQNGDFDVRLCVRNFPQQGLLAEPAEFESLDFSTALSADYEAAARFVVSRSGWLDGYLLWTRLDLSDRDGVDFLEHQQAWLPVWFPVGEQSVYIEAGTEIAVSWTCVTPPGQVFPDYRVETRWLLEGNKLRNAPDTQQIGTYLSRHHESKRGGTALHRSLLASLNGSAQSVDESLLKGWLDQQVPSYMVPANISLAAALPLNENRKLDRRALSQLAAAACVVAENTGGEGGAFEIAIGGLWAEVLGRPVSLTDNFFAAGGDSIAAVRLTTEVQRYLDDAVFLAALYEAPLLQDYCDRLREHYGAAVEKILAQTGTVSVATAVSRIEPLPAGPAPLSWAQQSLWFLQQLYPENTAANEQFVVRMRGIDPQRLISAWSQLIRRHNVLHSRFELARSGGDVEVESSVPVQCPADESVVALTATISDRLDLSGSSDAEAELYRLAGSEILLGFDLGAGPLLRPVLVRISDDDWALLVTAHHIVADGLCVPLIRDELLALYQGRQPAAPQVHFADFAGWQRSRVQGKWLEQELVWWRRHLQGVNTGPVDAVLPQVSSRGPESRFSFTVDAELTDRLRALVRDANTTLFVGLMAAWRVWLARCFRQQDFLIGSPVTERTSKQTATMLGCLVNNVAFRNSLDSQQGFLQALAGERENVLTSLDHSALPFEKIVEHLEPERVFARHPLFQFMFQYEERVNPSIGEGGEVFAVDVLPVDRTSYWDIELSVSDRGAGSELVCFLGVRNDLFERESAATWPESWLAFLRAVVDSPECSLSSLPLLSERQRAGLAAANATQAAVPESSIYELFARQAAAQPDAVALRQDKAQVTYGELLRQAQQYAQALADKGVVPGDAVGLCLGRGVDSVALMLAINMCGAAWLPLDPAYPSDRLLQMTQAVALRFIITDSAVAAGLPVAVMSAKALWSLGEMLLAQGQGGPASCKGDTLCFFFSSGSTGAPKCAALSQQAALSRCLWMWSHYGFGQLPGSAVEIFGHRTSLNFIDAVWEVFGALLHGASVDIAPEQAQQDMAQQAQWVLRQGITHSLVFPSALNILLGVWREQGLPASLHTLISTGEALTPSQLEQFVETLPDCRLINTYGTSENWDITTARVDARSGEALVPAGIPVANARVYVLDSQQQPLPAGLVGDLHVAGLGASMDSVNGVRQHQQRIFDEPDNPAGQVFATGDLASRRPCGELILHGRSDRQLKLRGVRIEPGEIEAIVTGLPEVQQAAVVLHGESGENAWLALYVVAGTGQPQVPEKLRERLNLSLPSAAVPAEINYLQSIPRTPSGKIDAAQLLRQIVPGVAEAPVFIAPISETEIALAEIWQQALTRDAIGRHDNFFALRGNSLLATRVNARVCDRFSVDLPLSCIFESPTVAELASMVDALLWAAEEPAPASSGDEREVMRL